MRKFLLTLVVATGLFYHSDAQDASMKKKPTLALNFVLNDFTTAKRIKNNSLGGVLKDKDWAQLNEMAYGLGIQYIEGLTKHVDFSGSLSGTFLKYPFPNKPTPGNESLLLELDAALNLKLLSDKYLLNPYAVVGVGVSTYKFSNYAASMPVGMGLQVNLGNQDAFFFAQGVYKTAVSGDGANHFTYSFGFAAPLKSNR